MGLFAKIRHFFEKSEQPKIAENSIVRYDTSSIVIPRYESLSRKDKEIVDKYIKETKISNLEELINYGKSTSEYSTGILQLLLSLYYKITEEKNDSNMTKKDMLKLSVDTLITNEQVLIYEKMLKDLEKEITLRTIALEQMFKQWKSEHKMMGMFKKNLD